MASDPPKKVENQRPETEAIESEERSWRLVCERTRVSFKKRRTRPFFGRAWGTRGVSPGRERRMESRDGTHGNVRGAVELDKEGDLLPDSGLEGELAAGERDAVVRVAYHVGRLAGIA